MPSPPEYDGAPGHPSGAAPPGSDAWVADRHAELTPLASALTDSTAQSAALLGAALARPGRSVPGLTSPSAAARVGLMTVYLGRSTGWADPRPADPPPADPPPADPPPAESSRPVPDATNLSTLTRLQRAVWALKEVEQLTQAEIASILDRPPAAVSRAREEAYARLGPDADVTLLRRSPAAPALTDVRRAYRHAQHRRSRRRGRIRGLVVLAVLVLAAVVAVPTYVIPRLPVYVREPGERVYMHTVTPPDGWQIDSRMLFDSGEGTFLSRTYGGAVPCSVYVDLAPQPDDTGPRVPVRINGRPALYAPDDASGPNITWWLEDRARVTVSCQPQTAADLGEAGRANLVLVAESVRFERTPALVPYTMTRVLDRYAVGALSSQADGSTAFGLQAVNPNPSDVGLVVRYQEGDTTGAGVSPRTVKVNGRDAVLSRDPDQPELCFTPPQATRPATVCVDAYWPSSTGDRLSAVPAAVIALMTRTAESLTFAGDPTDHSTWVDARTAFPR